MDRYNDQIEQYYSKFDFSTENRKRRPRRAKMCKYGSFRTQGSLQSKPVFKKPLQKTLCYEGKYEPESETEGDEEDCEFFHPEMKHTSADFGVQNEDIPELKNKNGMDLSTYDSVKNIPKPKSRLSSLEAFSDQETRKLKHQSSYSHLPNFEDIKHFESGLTDKEFMDVVVDRLRSIKEDITYKMFKNELLPNYKKPSFGEYARFRKLEIAILSKE